MFYFASLLQTNPIYQPAADRLLAALYSAGVEYQLIDGTHDIWLRDFMPVQIRDGSLVSFRYEPSYLENEPQLRTNFKSDLSLQFSFSVTYSDINLDGGNVVFSPSKEKAIISDRILTENSVYTQAELIEIMEQQLKAQIILIPSLKKKTDMTGHADGMVRFVNENTVIGNYVPSKKGLEQRIKTVLQDYGINVIDFPYFSSSNNSAIGCYLNFLETERYIFMPVFGNELDGKAIASAKGIFTKMIVPININEIAKEGGVLNCISWETKQTEKKQKIKSKRFLLPEDDSMKPALHF